MWGLEAFFLPRPYQILPQLALGLFDHTPDHSAEPGYYYIPYSECHRQMVVRPRYRSGIAVTESYAFAVRQNAENPAHHAVRPVSQELVSRSFEAVIVLIALIFFFLGRQYGFDRYNTGAVDDADQYVRKSFACRSRLVSSSVPRTTRKCKITLLNVSPLTC